MLSNIVTAAKGLFARPDSEEAVSANLSEASVSDKLKMVTATRQRVIRAEETTTESDTNRTSIANGKRKAAAANSGEPDGRRNKRRRSSLEAPETVKNGSSGIGEGSESTKREQVAASAKSNHVRFGSEEPKVADSVQTEEGPESRLGTQGNDDQSSDDDDAPEAIDNSAQMSKIKAESQRLQKAKQREEQLKKEKRRQLDEHRKLQAKLAAKKLEVTQGDDLVSESTVTLQGSTTQDSRRSVLPALLPDEILNAAPAARPPTPSPGTAGPGARKSNKLKFLDKVEKPPKDVKMGDVTIRVLDDLPSQKAKPSLPPKASKVGRNSKENWLKSKSSTARVRGLRMTAGGAATSSFARK